MSGIDTQRAFRGAGRSACRQLTLGVVAGLLTLSLARPLLAQDKGSALPAPQVMTAEQAAKDPMLAPPPDAPKLVSSWEEAIALIRSGSPDYATSREAVHRAEAQHRIALAPVLPSVIGNASYTHQFLTTTVGIANPPVVYPPPNVLGLGATASWTLLNPRALYGLGTANRVVEAAKLSDDDARKNLATSVVGEMLSTLAAGRVAELNRVGLRSSLERLGLAQARFQYGQGTALDVDRAQQDVAAARAQVINGDESLLESRESFGAALGSSTPASAAPSLELESFERAVAQTCRLNEEIEARPDVAAARLRVEVAERAITDADLQAAPTLSISSQVAYASEVTFGPLTTWTLAGLITVPFYDGGLRYGARRDAIAVAAQAKAALEATRINAVVSSARAHREVTVLGSARDLAREQRDISKRVDERTRDAYSRGQGTSLDLVTSAQALRAAEVNLALLEFQVAQARANAVLANAECVF